MAVSSVVVSGNVAAAADYNNLRTDVLSTTLGHVHDGTNGREHGDGVFKLRNPADTFSYVWQTSAIVANRDVTLPLLTGNDILVLEAHTQTLTNKTLTSPSLSSPTITGSPTAAGATWADLGAVTTVDINGGTVDGVTIGAAGGLSQIRAQDDGLQVENPAATFAYTLTGAAIAANRSLTLPLLTGADTLVAEAHTQTLANKTLTTPSLQSTPAVIDANGIDYNPGSDADTDIITVGVTGTPNLKWDEAIADAVGTRDGWSTNKGFEFTDGDAQLNVVGGAADNEGKQGVVRALVRKQGVADNTATDVFKITTDDVSGSFDGGSYVCHVRGSVTHESSNNAANHAVKGFGAHFAVTNAMAGTAARTSVTEDFETAAAANSGSVRSIGTVTMTLVATSSYITTVQFTVDLTGTTVTNGDVVLLVEVIWHGYKSKAPTVEAA